jgi:hypothetical protein
MRASESDARLRRLKLGAAAALLVAEVLVALAVLLVVLG